MATPIFSKITMTTRIGAEPWKRKRRRGVRGHVESPSEVALLLGLGGRRVSRPQRTDLHPPANGPEVLGEPRWIFAGCWFGEEGVNEDLPKGDEVSDGEMQGLNPRSCASVTMTINRSPLSLSSKGDVPKADASFCKDRHKSLSCVTDRNDLGSARSPFPPSPHWHPWYHCPSYAWVTAKLSDLAFQCHFNT